MAKAIVGVIGGSGVYHLPGLADLREETVSTPWGDPSDALRFGRIGSTEAVFLARHGRGHRFSPSTINYRANIDALKRARVTDIIALSACGSFRRELYPGMFVMIDQFVDRTYLRQSTFFGTGCVAHVSMAHPIAPLLRLRLVAAAKAEGIPHRDGGGTYVCMEGPQFSSLAESLGYQAGGADVIGMTGATEAKLAREAEISYATIAMVTDYDCWHEEHGAVDVTSVIKVVADNADKASALVARTLRDFPAEHEACPAGSDRALEHAIITPPGFRDPELVKKLDAVAGRVLRTS
jgi:5'-methylthioadenosine phosphorylase